MSQAAYLIRELAEEPRIADWLELNCSPAEIEAARTELLALSERWPREDLDTMQKVFRDFVEEWVDAADDKPVEYGRACLAIKEAMEEEIEEASAEQRVWR